ncbi:MAG TPA: methyltransferase domain-containing protein [Bryobacteraceae bacterium]|nr:methyltransferase domain-containing protein [Bryobacteraceae bacterium]
MSPELPSWALKMAGAAEKDAIFPHSLNGINFPLNRRRLAAFLTQFQNDQDVHDFVALDLLASNFSLPLSSTGLKHPEPLMIRPFRLWEYVWLYKCLNLASGTLSVLDLGGPASHLSIMAALAGCQVTSIDINPEFVKSGRECGEMLQLNWFQPKLGDMRDLSAFEDNSFDVVVSCSVLEHLIAEDQILALRQAARVLKPGGRIGLTFDYGPAAPGANIHLPPPHDPPFSAAEARRRYLQGGLIVLGEPFREDPIPSSLFLHDSIQYTVASLFLAAPPSPPAPAPMSRKGNSVLGHLQIANIGYRAFERVAVQQQAEAAGQAAELQTEIGTRDQALGEARQQLEHAVEQLRLAHERAAAVELEAERRLEGWRSVNRTVASLRSDLERCHTEAGELRVALERADKLLSEQGDQNRRLEAAAQERLDELQRKDKALADLRSQLECAVATVNEQSERASRLEAAAQERLDELQRKDKALADLRSQLECAVATVNEQSEMSAPAQNRSRDRRCAL